MAHPTGEPTTGGVEPSSRPPDDAVIERLDRAMRRLRSAMVRPEITTLPIPDLGRVVDLSKVLACMVVAELTDSDSPDSDPTPCVTVKDVAKALGLVHSSASRLLVETEAEGLISRHSDPADRRRTCVRLTDEGATVVVQSTRLRTFALAKVLSGWRDDEVDSLTALLERFGDSVRARSHDAIIEATRVFSDPAGPALDHVPAQPSPTEPVS